MQPSHGVQYSRAQADRWSQGARWWLRSFAKANKSEISGRCEKKPKVCLLQMRRQQ